MSRRGRRASLPPADHSRPERTSPNGLIVVHHNHEGRPKSYDFSTLQVPEPMQRSLAALFAARCRPDRWSSHDSSRTPWSHLQQFTTFLATQGPCSQDLDGLSAAVVDHWWETLKDTTGGRSRFGVVCSLLRDDLRLQGGSIADAISRRIPVMQSKTQSYNPAEFRKIRTEARRMFRAALLRIEDNAQHLERWRSGQIPSDTPEWLVGEVLDVLAETGDVPRVGHPGGQRTLAKKYRKALGGGSAEATWQRLFLTRTEAAALSVLLMTEFGWNLSVIDRAQTPKAAPDQGQDGQPTYRIPVEKRKRGGGRWFETENVTDHGAGSSGRLITQTLAATRFARAIVTRHDPDADLLVVSRSQYDGRPNQNSGRRPPIGPFFFGLTQKDAWWWAQAAGTGGSPFRRGRRTVTATERREPSQHSQETHDRRYVLPDRQVRDAAVPVIASGAESAVALARKAVLIAEMRDTRNPNDAETATADCSDAESSPWPAPDGGCGASFLMCLACPSAHVHADHHPRLAHLHQSLASLRSAISPREWTADWADHHARLNDLQRRVGEQGWRHALTRVTDADRAIVNLLLTGDLNA